MGSSKAGKSSPGVVARAAASVAAVFMRGLLKHNSKSRRADIPNLTKRVLSSSESFLQRSINWARVMNAFSLNFRRLFGYGGDVSFSVIDAGRQPPIQFCIDSAKLA
jgi:hypothetical protein